METQHYFSVTLQHLLIGGERKTVVMFLPDIPLSGRAEAFIKVYIKKYTPKAFLFKGQYGVSYIASGLRQVMRQALKRAGNSVLSFQGHKSRKIAEICLSGRRAYICQTAFHYNLSPPDRLDFSHPNRMLGPKLRQIYQQLEAQLLIYRSCGPLTP